MRKYSSFLLLFFVVSIIQIAGASAEWNLLQDISKPFIVISLIGYYWMTAERRSILFVWALVFCLLGDVLLIFQPTAELFFIFGLVGFLIGHLFYMVSYNKLRWEDKGGELLTVQKLRLSFPIVLAGTGLITVLFPKLGVLKVPVVVYSIVLVGMVMTALFRYGRTSSASFWRLFIGAVLFMISDSILAVNKFFTPLPYASLLIMLTYIVAQYLIVEGAIRHTESPRAA